MGGRGGRESEEQLQVVPPSFYSCMKSILKALPTLSSQLSQEEFQKKKKKNYVFQRSFPIYTSPTH